VIGVAGAPIEIKAETTCEYVEWFPLDPGLHCVRPELFKDSRLAVVFAPVKGEYRLAAWTALNNKPSKLAVVIVAVAPPGPGPGPDPGPGPGPGPTPIPVPVDGLRVIFVYESASKLSREQLNILNSTKIAEYLNSKTVKDQDGQPGWRTWDKDVDVQFAPQLWKDLWASTKPQLSNLPALLIVSGKKGEVFPLPATESETIALLQKYGK
jgi:hypothetical protein